MTLLPNNQAEAQARQYREKIIVKLQELGYVVKLDAPVWHNADNTVTFVVSGEPRVKFSLIDRSTNRDSWARSGTPVLEFRPDVDTGYGSGFRAVSWREDAGKKGWTDATAAKHAAKVAEFIEYRRAMLVKQQQGQQRRDSLQQRANAINERLGINTTEANVYADHNEHDVTVKFTGHWGFTSDATVETVLRELHEVLKRHKL
jgi:hypothetical protein